MTSNVETLLNDKYTYIFYTLSKFQTLNTILIFCFHICSRDLRHNLNVIGRHFLKKKRKKKKESLGDVQLEFGGQWSIKKYQIGNRYYDLKVDLKEAIGRKQAAVCNVTSS